MSLTPRGGIAFGWVCASVSLIFVLLRLYARVFVRCIFSISDAFVIISWLCLLYAALADTFVYNVGLPGNSGGTRLTTQGIHRVEEKQSPSDAEFRTTYKLFYAGGILFYTGLWCTKAAFLFLYYRIAKAPGFEELLRSMKVALDITVGVAVASWIVVAGLNAFSCLPISRIWSLDLKQNCQPFPLPSSYFVSLALHLFTNLLILAIPYPLLRHLSAFPFRRMLSVAFMFLMGIICISITIGRAAAVGTTFNLVTLSAWTAAEQATGIIIVCCPPLYIFHGSLAATRRQDEVYEIIDLEAAATANNTGRNGQTIVMVNETVVSGGGSGARIGQVPATERVEEWGTFSPRRRSRNSSPPTPAAALALQQQDAVERSRSLSSPAAKTPRKVGRKDSTGPLGDRRATRDDDRDRASSARDEIGPSHTPHRIPLYVRPMTATSGIPEMMSPEEANIVDRVVEFQSRFRNI